MEIKVNALALKSVDYKDNDKMLTLFSIERGLLSAGIKGVKKAGAKLRFCTQPFCFAEYIISVKGDRYTVTGATEIESFYNVRLDVLNFYAGSAILEFLLKQCAEGEQNEQLFVHVINSLKKIAFGEIAAKQNLIRFLVRALELIGYGFTFKACLHCGGQLSGYERCYFDFEKGGAVCQNCAQFGVREVLPATVNGIFNVMNGLEESEEVLNYVLKFLHYYIEYKTGVKITCIEEIIKLKA